ncbi:MAG: dockerin type I repeat-containing protein [Clostridia bacterium]|nr:dockerin type I repeat-containing protein [Clostridia bacterium]
MKIFRNIISVLVVLTFVVSSISLLFAEDTVLVYSQADLKAIGSSTASLSKNYKLMNDIELTGSWTPIGTSSRQFTGTFDGNGFAIKNLSIEALSTCQGLFAYTQNAVISNLTVYGKVYSYSSITPISQINLSYIGGIAGGASNTQFINCTNYADVYGLEAVGGIAGHCKNSTFENCKNYGAVVASSAYGGICGRSIGSSYTACANFGSVYGSSMGGGICGWTFPEANAASISVSQCVNFGSVTASQRFSRTNSFSQNYAGGIVGYVQTLYNGIKATECSVSDSFNAGDLFSDNSTAFLGGICGSGTTSAEAPCLISSCYTIGRVPKYSNSGAIAGSNSLNAQNCYFLNNSVTQAFPGSSSIPASTPEAFKSAATFAGFDFENLWEISSEAEYKYPSLKNNPLTFTKQATSIAIKTAPSKTAFVLGEDLALDTSNMALTVQFNDGTSATVTEGFTVDECAFALGVNPVKISYLGAEAYLKVTVYESVDDKNLIDSTESFLPIYNVENLKNVKLFPDADYFMLSDVTSNEKIESIGTLLAPFTGKFMGNEYTVNAKISGNGLFGFMENALVSGLTVSGTVSGKGFCGGIAGISINSSIYDCTVTSTVSASPAENTMFAGGIVGFWKSPEHVSFTNNTFSGALNINTTASNVAVGGICGAISFTENTLLEKSANNGSITVNAFVSYSVGGICGAAYTTANATISLDQCYNSGSISTSGLGVNVGGILGNASSSCNINVSNSFNTGTISCANYSAYASGITPLLSNAGSKIIACYNAGKITVNNNGQASGIATSNNKNGTVENCFCLSFATTDDSATTLDKYTSLLQQSYSGFDFSKTWTVGEKYLFPQLKLVTFDVSALEEYTVIPTVTGVPKAGSTLSAENDASLYYQWCKDGVAIDGETSSSYTLSVEDEDSIITLKTSKFGLYFGTTTSENVYVVSPISITSDVFKVTNGSIFAITSGTTVEQLLQGIKDLPQISTVTKGETVLTESDLISTGAILKLENAGYQLSYELFVLGDIDGDGSITYSDAELLRNYLLTGKNEPEIKAADMNFDGKIDAKDSILLKQAISE